MKSVASFQELQTEFRLCMVPHCSLLLCEWKSSLDTFIALWSCL